MAKGGSSPSPIGLGFWVFLLLLLLEPHEDTPLTHLGRSPHLSPGGCSRLTSPSPTSNPASACPELWSKRPPQCYGTGLYIYLPLSTELRSSFPVACPVVYIRTNTGTCIVFCGLEYRAIITYFADHTGPICGHWQRLQAAPRVL